MNAIEKEIEKSDKYLPIIKKILRNNPHLFISNIRLVKATPEEDQKEGFDAVIKMPNMQLPIRIRNNEYKKYFDFTIRTRSHCGDKTEFDKIKEGCGDYYFYCWLNIDKKIDSCIIVDLAVFRSCLIDYPDQRDISNNDGTKFNAYTIPKLNDNKCLIAKWNIGL